MTLLKRRFFGFRQRRGDVWSLLPSAGLNGLFSIIKWPLRQRLLDFLCFKIKNFNNLMHTTNMYWSIFWMQLLHSTEENTDWRLVHMDLDKGESGQLGVKKQVLEVEPFSLYSD